MKLGEFFIDLIVDSSKGEITVSDLVTKMGELEVATIGAVGALFQIGAKLAGFTDVAIKTALGLKDFSTLTDENTDSLQKWERVAAHAHISGDAVVSTFRGLSSAIATMNRGGGTGRLQPLIDMLGLNPSGKSAEEILKFIQHSSRFAALSNKAKTDLLEAAGIEPLLATIFKMPDEEFNRIGGLVDGMSKDSVEKFSHMASALSDISSIAKQIALDIAAWDAGPFLAVLNSIIGAFKEIKQFTKENVTTTSDSQVKAFDMAVRPISREGKSAWADMFRYIMSGEALADNRLETPRVQGMIAGYPQEYYGAISSATPSAPAQKNVTVNHTQNYKVGADLEDVRRVSREGAREVYDTHLSETGTVLDQNSR